MIDWFWVAIILSVCVLGVAPFTLYNYLFTDTLFYMCFGAHLLLLIGYMLWRPPHSEEFRQLSCWQWLIHDYFNFEPKGEHAHLLSAPNSSQQYIWAVHPHGLFASVTSYWLTSPNLLHCRAAGSSLLFYIPGVKEIISLLGVVPANRQNIIVTLNCGESIVVTPGGMREILTRQEIYKEHLGFLRIAKATNVPVIPVYAKGVDKLYSVWLFWPALQSIVLHILLYPIYVGALGNPYLWFWPKRPLNGIELWVGEPIHVKGSIADAATQFYSEMDRLENKN